MNKVLKFRQSKKGGAAPARTRVQHPIDRRLAELKDGEGKPRTRAWLAEQVGCSPQYISQICTGRRPINPNSFFFLKLKRALGVTLDFFCGTGSGRSA